MEAKACFFGAGQPRQTQPPLSGGPWTLVGLSPPSAAGSTARTPCTALPPAKRPCRGWGRAPRPMLSGLSAQSAVNSKGPPPPGFLSGSFEVQVRLGSAAFVLCTQWKGTGEEIAFEDAVLGLGRMRCSTDLRRSHSRERSQNRFQRRVCKLGSLTSI